MIKLDFRLFLKMSRLGEFRVGSGSSFQSWTAEGKKDVMYSKDENSHVMFVDLKSYVEGSVTHYQQ